MYFQQKPQLGKRPNLWHWSKKNQPLSLDMLAKGDLYNYGTDKLTVTNNGATAINGPNGGGALRFNSDTDYVEVPDRQQLNAWPEYAMVACVRRESNYTGFAARARIMDKNGGQVAWALRDNNNLQVFQDGSWRTGVSYTPPIDQWVTLAVTYKGTTVTYYADGEVLGTDTSVGAPGVGSGLLYIGNQGSNDEDYWHGSIGSFSLIEGFRTAQQIKSLTFDPWQAYQRGLSLPLIAAAQGGAGPTTSVNLLDGLFERKRLIA